MHVTTVDKRETNIYIYLISWCLYKRVTNAFIVMFFIATSPPSNTPLQITATSVPTVYVLRALIRPTKPQEIATKSCDAPAGGRPASSGNSYKSAEQIANFFSAAHGARSRVLLRASDREIQWSLWKTPFINRVPEVRIAVFANPYTRYYDIILFYCGTFTDRPDGSPLGGGSRLVAKIAFRTMLSIGVICVCATNKATTSGCCKDGERLYAYD